MNEQKLKQAIQAALSLEGDKIDTARVASRVATYMVMSEKMEEKYVGAKWGEKEKSAKILENDNIKELIEVMKPSHIPTPPKFIPVSPMQPYYYDPDVMKPRCEEGATVDEPKEEIRPRKPTVVNTSRPKRSREF